MFGRPSNQCLWDIPSLENKKLVAKSDATCKSKVYHPARGEHQAETSIELNRMTSHDVSSEIDFCKFVSRLLQLKHFPPEQANYIAKHAWRVGTLKEKKGMVKYWENYTSEKNKAFFDLTFETLLGFLDFERNKSQKFSVVHRAHDFIVVTKKIVGEQLSSAQHFLVDKYIAAALNTNPPLTYNGSLLHGMSIFSWIILSN